MSFRKIPYGVLGTSFAYIVGFLVYRLVVRHSLPHWSDVPTYLVILAAFAGSTIATEWFFQRRAHNRSEQPASRGR